MFIGGPWDECQIVLTDLPPVYRVPVKDKVYALDETPMIAVQYAVLEYRRTRVCEGDSEHKPHAVYELDL